MKQKSNSYVKHVKGSVFYQNSNINVKMFSNLKNKSIAVNITLKWNVKWSKCSRPFFFKPKYYQGAESIYNDRMFNLLNLQKQEKVPCCITDIFLHHCHHITNRVWEISCYITIFYIPVLKYTCNNFTFMKFHLKIIINKIFYEP